MKRILLVVLSAASLWAAEPGVKLPPFTRQVFGNGVVLLLAPKSDVPTIAAQLVVRGGSESDPAGMAGLAAVTAELLRSGTQKRTADQINQELDALGALLTTQTNRQATIITTEFLAKDSDKVIDLLSDLFARPSFPEADVAKEMSRRIDGMRGFKDNPGMAVMNYLPAFFYPPQHPYSHPIFGDEVSLAKINRQAIVDYHKQMYTGKNLIVSVAGDFDPKIMGSKLSILRFLGGGAGWTPPAKPVMRIFDSPRLLLVDKPDATQTYFLIAQPGVERTSPDRVPLQLINTLFGERFTSMLNDELRVNTGLTYGARSQVDKDRLSGAIYINTFTKTETTERAIDLAVEVLKRLADRGIDEEMLASAKAYVKGSIPTQMLETDRQLAGLLAELEIHGLNRGEVDDMFSAIDAVTMERANEVARRYYRSANLQFCLVGNASAIQSSVTKYASKMKTIPIKDPGFAVPEF